MFLYNFSIFPAKNQSVKFMMPDLEGQPRRLVYGCHVALARAMDRRTSEP